MKKFLLLATVALGALTASAQAVEQPGFFKNWSIGIDGGGTTPLHHAAFWGDMRGIVGINLKKQITPTFGLGVEGQFDINTSSWHNMTYNFFGDEMHRNHSNTAFDGSYVGTFGTVDLFNLFGGYPCKTRPFTIEAMAGAGWGHYYFTAAEAPDYNYFATKAGLNFNINCSDQFTIAIKPSVQWNMNNVVEQSPVSYNINKAVFNLEAGLVWHMGGTSFACVEPRNQAEIDALNGQINELQAALAACMVNSANWEAKAAGLANDLAKCMAEKQKVEIVEREKTVVKTIDTNTLTSIRYVFYKIGSSVITADQMPNVEMIAAYLKHNPDAKVEIKGYASQDGPLDVNIRLANARAESVKTALMKKYGIKADRIKAEGEGIGNMFKEESWNRVSICIIEDKD